MSENTQPIVVGEQYGVAIQARLGDNSIDVTALCQTHGKEWWTYARTDGAKRFRKALSLNLAINEVQNDPENDGLVVQTRDGNRQGHIFADRRIALHCAAWISEEFEV